MSANINPQRRWWQYKRTWIIGLPLIAILGVVGLFAWGTSQPKPDGFAPTVEATSDNPIREASSSGVTSAPEQTEASETTSTTDDPGSVENVTPEPSPTRYTVDARSKEEWVLFDFKSGQPIDGDFTTPGWDIALQRTHLLTNSGVTNPSGPGGAFDLGEVLLEDAVAPETAAFATDVLGGEDEDDPENPEISGWYKYSFMKHVVSVKPNTYVVRTGTERDVLLQFDSYYCDDEEPACVTFRYRMIPKVTAPTP